MESNYECGLCHRRKKTAFGAPKCNCNGYTKLMMNVTGRPLYMYECPACHTRKRASLGSPKCSSCGRLMSKAR